ncbi:DUF397 domain-containing protein [Nocardiopsis sp. RSe5-2]|uniref:DUF397 domain-containing protein n=1 Tax=Nocardiopsis endophytica TaxID=3018445 RepID=A0ABT4U713_9ACTN|nr:DUF397 domain-containing protein [Nocardiopsis endophytica]MDA2812738.1 DUF397 domain-containing protein [Nocardiopsis endophytica]
MDEWRKSSYSGGSNDCVEFRLSETWQKSSHSKGGDANCVECRLGESWHKSSFSKGDSNCVECRSHAHVVQVRDSQNPGRGHLDFPSDEWQAFLRHLRTHPL